MDLAEFTLSLIPSDILVDLAEFTLSLIPSDIFSGPSLIYFGILIK